jgi:HEXXH motif-containing protein
MHRLPQADFDALASGLGDRQTIDRLRRAELSKHVLLLRAVLETAARDHPDAYAELEMVAAFRILSRVQERSPEKAGELLSRPQAGAWAVDCLHRMGTAAPGGRGLRVSLAYFNAIVAAAAIPAGECFELPIALPDGTLNLPGFGDLRHRSGEGWGRLRCTPSGLTLMADGSVRRLSGASWTRPERPAVTCDGLALQVDLDSGGPFLDRYAHEPIRRLAGADLDRWHRRLSDAWEILARHHPWQATAIAAGLHMIVPLSSGRAAEVVSATSGAAFGAIATSLPPDGVTLAETLVHEFQHVKLCALLDLLPLVRPGSQALCYAPWREDPRPLSGLLQGAYAYLGVTRFWRAQRLLDPGSLRAQVEFARRRAETLAAARTLMLSGRLTAEGRRFVGRMYAQVARWQSEPVPALARRLADDAIADHLLMWRLRHLEPSTTLLDGLFANWRSGSPPGPVPAGPEPIRVPDARFRISPSGRELMHTLRHTEPHRFRHWLDHGVLPGRPADPDLSAGDVALLREDPAGAAAAYLAEIAAGPDRPEPWAGLVLALHRLAADPVAALLARRLPLVYALHRRIRAESGATPDPLELAGWLTARSPETPVRPP